MARPAMTLTGGLPALPILGTVHPGLAWAATRSHVRRFRYVSAPRDAPDSPRISAPLAGVGKRQEQQREAADRGRRRRRRTLVMAAVLVPLVAAIYSYSTWMLRPSSLPFGVRSVEWVRADVPFGNSLVDEIEHVYYSWKAPKKGGPQLKSLPATGPATKAPKEAAAWPRRI